MSDNPNHYHKQLLREARLAKRNTNNNSSDGDNEEPRRKKRNVKKQSLNKITTELREDQDQHSFDESSDSGDFEDIDLGVREPPSDASSAESEDFEEISLDTGHSYQFDEQSNNGSAAEADALTIQIRAPEEEDFEISKTGKGRSKVNFVSKEERRRRVQIHKKYIALMLIHLILRNRWCNAKDIGKKLKRACVTTQTQQLLTYDSKNSPLLGSRKLLDALKKIMAIYSEKFRITVQGLVRKDWQELGVIQEAEVVTKNLFKKLVSNYRGSRDVAAQGFVTLLRALGLNARLVFSLQPPDYTIITSPTKLLEEHTKSNVQFMDSPYPIFWVEVYDKYKNSWISIDPIVMKIIETCPKRKKSSFEPPATDERNLLHYALAIDKVGRVRDVTRRYCINYNAKTIRKRISFRSTEDEDWYENLLQAANRGKKRSVCDIYEIKEFHERDLAEGMPNNLQGFKNHPLYALESQLRQNEVISPKDKSSVCGTFRIKSSGKLVDVYKRSCVKRLRSAKAWYMRGRILKIGAMPMKTKFSGVGNGGVGGGGHNVAHENNTDDEEVRLYAESQTKLYIPKIESEDRIPKNAYGNVDVYTESMIPENCCLIRISDTVSLKLLQKTAQFLGIDYAKAITSFDFTQRSKGGARTPNAKEGGIVVLKTHEEATRVAVDFMIEMEEYERKMQVEENALKNWRFFLLKLRLQNRLNKSHGVINDDSDTIQFASPEKKRGEEFKGKEVEEEEEEDEADGEEEEEEVEEGYFDGGFVVDDHAIGLNDSTQLQGGEFEESSYINKVSDRNGNDDNSDDDEGEEAFDGGFIVSDSEPNESRDHNDAIRHDNEEEEEEEKKGAKEENSYDKEVNQEYKEMRSSGRSLRNTRKRVHKYVEENDELEDDGQRSSQVYDDDDSLSEAKFSEPSSDQSSMDFEYESE